VARPADDKIPLTVAIIALDAAAQIGPLLDSVRFADEVLVVDSGSRDATCELARRHGARVETHEWLGFGRQKQHAVSIARNDWVLCLDADERVTGRLAQSIRQALAGPRTLAADDGPAVVVVEANAKPAIGYKVGGLSAATIFVKDVPAWAKDAPRVKAKSAKDGNIDVAPGQATEATLFVIK